MRLDKTFVLARVERQHALIEALRAAAPRAIRGERLAELLAVSRRTIERDAADLVEAGVPLAIRRGRGGGYTFEGRSSLRPLHLTPGEAAAVIASMVAVGPFLSGTATSALDKVIRALVD